MTQHKSVEQGQAYRFASSLRLSIVLSAFLDREEYSPAASRNILNTVTVELNSLNTVTEMFNTLNAVTAVRGKGVLVRSDAWLAVQYYT